MICTGKKFNIVFSFEKKKKKKEQISSVNVICTDKNWSYFDLHVRLVCYLYFTFLVDYTDVHF